MVTTRLDPIDRKILAELQADGRMTNVELARRVGISAPPCLRRVRTLEEAGLIRGYHADVDARARRLTITVSWFHSTTDSFPVAAPVWGRAITARRRAAASPRTWLVRLGLRLERGARRRFRRWSRAIWIA